MFGFMTTEDRIAELEAQIGKLQIELGDLRQQVAKAQIDQWQGRIEDLQVHLGAMEASDKLTALMDRLRNQWADARRQFEEDISPGRPMEGQRRWQVRLCGGG